MSSLGTTTYNMEVKDLCTTSGKGTQILNLSSRLTAEVSASTCGIKELVVRGRNKNKAVLGNADIKLSGTFEDTTNAAHNSDWLRAVARMFNHLADNMDQFPTHTQTIAQMVANKLD